MQLNTSEAQIVTTNNEEGEQNQINKAKSAFLPTELQNEKGAQLGNAMSAGPNMLVNKRHTAY